MGSAEIHGKIAAADEVPVTNNDGMGERGAKFADVSRPSIAVEELADFGIHTANLTAVFGIEVAQNVLDERGNILLAIAQSGQMNMEDVQPEIEILPELAVRNRLFGVLIRGGEDAHIHRRLDFTPQAPDLSIFEDPQQFSLGGRWHFTDLVQKQRSAIRQFKTAHAPLRRSGKGAAFMPEHPALHQRVTNDC